MNIKIKKYIKWALPIVVFLVSFKAILFTWDLIRAGYHYRTDKQQAAIHMYALLLDKPSVYKAFQETNAEALDNLVFDKDELNAIDEISAKS